MTAFALLATAEARDEPVAAAANRKRITIPRSTTPPRIDGRLDDVAWQSAARITDASQYQPGDGLAPTEATEFWLSYDDDNLYIAAWFGDSQPQLIKRSQLVQGQAVFNDDYFQILLDTYNNKRTGYILYVNPNGVQRDGLGLGGLAFNMDWDGIWEAEAKVDGTGWTAEVALPFKTLSFDPNNQTWGINLLRSIRRKREEIAWSHDRRRINFDLAGEITGLTGLRQGRGLDIVPSVASTNRERLASGESTLLTKPSLDAFWRITPSLRAALTVNTDFSATEVDDRQVNLSRFSLFFPEKRDFFLDDAEVFEFAGLAQNGRPFFSRTIGLSASGQPIDLDAGVKLTGRVGRYNVGALAVRQEAAGAIDARSLLVARAYANVLEQTTLGAIFTSGDPVSNDDNRLFGLDAVYRGRVGRDVAAVDAKLWWQQSKSAGIDGDDAAFGASFAYPNDRWDGLLGFSEIQENFRPALGFVNRAGIRQYDGRLKRRARLANGRRIRSWVGGIEAREITDRDGDLQSRLVIVTPLSIDTQPGDMLTVDLLGAREVLAQRFLLPGGFVSAGDYDFTRIRLNYTGAGFRRFAPTLEFEAGDFYDGRRFDTRLGLQWRPNRHLFMNAQYLTNKLELPNADFIARTYILTTNLAFNVHWAWLNVAQYDNVSGRLGFNSRLRWLPAQGQAAYLVFNYDWREDPFGNFKPSIAETTLKLSYTFRY